MARLSGHSFVIGRSEKEGILQDVRVTTTAEGLNRVEIARDAKDTSPRIYVVERRVLPKGAWKRLLEVESFTDFVGSEQLSEVRAIVEYETIPNVWGIVPNKTWGLPAGMESPWIEPLEMVGNELLVPLDTKWVSGDSPINTVRDNLYENGKYSVQVSSGRIAIEDKIGEEPLGTIFTNTDFLQWSEGVAGSASFRGGSLFIEPAKPPIFMGSFVLEQTPIYIAPGLYQYGNNFIISNIALNGRSGVGAISFVKDPFPERWVNRLMGRAYVQLISPAHVPPLIEDEPKRVGVFVHNVQNDYPGIQPKTITPYANKTGVFNAWDITEGNVIYSPKERPWDVLLPFNGPLLEDWGGFSVYNPGVFYPALDWKDEEGAAFPQYMGYELPEIPELPKATLSFRWKDSGFFSIINNETLDIYYKEGYIYFTSKVAPDATGIGKIIVSSDWNFTKIEWTPNSLFINDVPALTEELRWDDMLSTSDPFDNTLGNQWGDTANIPPSQWTPSGEFPIDIEQFEEIPPTWATGLPEGEVEREDPDYSHRPRTWGRVLYEPFGFPNWGEDDIDFNSLQLTTYEQLD